MTKMQAVIIVGAVLLFGAEIGYICYNAGHNKGYRIAKAESAASFDKDGTFVIHVTNREELDKALALPLRTHYRIILSPGAY